MKRAVFPNLPTFLIFLKIAIFNPEPLNLQLINMNNSNKIKFILIPSIADVIFLCLFLYLSFFVGKGLLKDCDTGYHIRAGEYIIETLSIPRQDIFSFHEPPLSWTAHEWLSEVIMAMVHRSFGLTGIVIFFSFIISLAYSLFFKILKADNDIVLSVFFAILVLASSQIHWLARPHIFSLLLMILWYYILDEYQYKDRNYLYVLPPVMLLWVNLHGGFLAGFILIGIYLFGNVLGFITPRDLERGIYQKKVKLLGITTFICLFACLINPFAYQILIFPFKLVSSKFIMDHISEFMPPNFHNPFLFFKYFLLLMVAIFSLSAVKTNFIELLLILMFTNMSLYSARYIPLFSIIAAPILLKQLKAILEHSDGRVAKFLRKRSDNISEIDTTAKGYLWPIAAIILVAFFVGTNKINFNFDEKKKPVATVEFLKNEKIHGNLFNKDEYGDYIIYAAWPEYRVFIDGRLDMYGVDMFKEYIKVVNIEPGWDEVVKKYDISWIIYNANSPLSLLLMHRDDWKLIYADEVANIFVKNIQENRYLIEKYPDVELVIPDPDESEQ